MVDNEFRLLIDEILECNMPEAPNPLVNWHEIDYPIKDLHIDEFTGEKIPRTPKEFISPNTRMLKRK